MDRLAIDLGTSNTVAVLCGEDGRIRPVLFDGREQLPSAVHADADGVLVAGHDAERLARADPAGFEPNPKRRVDDGTVLLGRHTVAVADVLAAVLTAVANRLPVPTPAAPPAPAPAPAAVPGVGSSAPAPAGAQGVGSSASAGAAGAGPPAPAGVPGVGPSAPAGAAGAGLSAGAAGPDPSGAGGAGLRSVVLTVPAGWGTPRREVLAGAAARAGLGAVEFVSEPVAAAAYCAATRSPDLPPGASLLVVDLGAGTADLAVVRDGRVVAQGGLEVGGLDVDAALVGVLGDVVSATEPDVWARLAAPVTAADRRDRLLLWQEVRAAKESLSRLSVAPVHVPGCRSDPHLTREELDAVAAPLLAPIADLAAALTAAAAAAGPTAPAAGLDAAALTAAARAAPATGPAAPAAGPVAPAAGPVAPAAGLDAAALTAAARPAARAAGPVAPAAGLAAFSTGPGVPGAGLTAPGAGAAAPGAGPAAVFLVGGGSRLPLLARILHARLGVAPTTVERPETVVAEGALHATARVEAHVAPVVASVVPAVPARTPLRRRWRSPATVVLVLLCFALPFATVSCGLPDGYGRAQPGGTSEYTGFDLATGGAPTVRADQLRPPGQRRPDRLDPQPAHLTALALLVAVLAAAGLGSDRRRRVVTAVLAGLAAAAVVAGQVVVAGRLAAAVVEQSRLPQGKTAGDMVGTGAGFWLAVTLLTLLTAANLTALARRPTTRPSKPSKPAKAQEAQEAQEAGNVSGRRTGG